MGSAKGGKSTLKALVALVGIVATILLGYLLIHAAAILQPLVIALLLCSILQPVVRALARFRIPPWVTVVALLSFLVWAMAAGGELLFAEVRAFAGHEEGGLEFMRGKLTDRIVSWEMNDIFSKALIELIASINPSEWIVGLLGTFKDFTLGVFLVVLYMIFIFAEQAVFRRKILAVASARADDAEQVLDSISLGIQRYLGVKTITSLATAVLCYSVLLTLNLPYALLFGFLTFLLNYIPTFGSFAAAILPISTAFADNVGITEPLIVAGTYLTVNVLLGSFLEPRLLGRELNLSPLVILVSVVVWAALWGVPGAFLAVPLTATAQIVLSNFESTRNIAVLLSNGPPREPRVQSSS